MRRRTITFLAILGALLLMAGSAQAKWWIFGRSQEEVGLDYLYINNVAFDERDGKITIYRESLPDGNLIIRGKALAGRNLTGSVQVSTDSKETWEKCRLSNDGTFEYVFKPAVGETYELYVKAIDTTGKSNDVDATHRTVTISPESVSASVKEVLAKLVQAYSAENARQFMDYVSQDFAGDDVVLERAIRKDFTAFDNIELKFTVSSTATGPGGNVYASLLFNRYVTSTKTGRPFSDKGTTEFVFKPGPDGLKLFSMKNPLIFGLSDAAEVATGSTINATNQEVLVVSPTGAVQKLPFDQALNAIENGGAGGNTAPVITGITGQLHHYIVLSIDLRVDNPDNYDITIEEALSPTGPWENVYGGAAGSTIQLTTQSIASEDTLLYYRVRLEDMTTNEWGDWSNVATWDNR